MYRIFAIGNEQGRTEVDTEDMGIEDEQEAAQFALDTLLVKPGEKMFELNPDADFEPIAEWRKSALTGEAVKVSG